MPEMTFTVRWPDGRADDCWSPSLVVWDHLVPGTTYPVAEFVERAVAALEEGGERVRARYGFLCSSALGEAERIRAEAAAWPGDAEVRVVAMAPPLPVSP